MSNQNNQSNTEAKLSLRDSAELYLGLGLSVVPLQEDKRPATKEWKSLQTQRLQPSELETYFKPSVPSIGIVCGAISGGLEVIDVDIKHDTTGKLWEELSELLSTYLFEETYSSLVIAKTKNGGFHIYYKSDSIPGNIPDLARNTSKESLIETRGEGGYVVAPPTRGYSFYQNDLSSIPKITPNQRELILNICRSFNQLQKESPKEKHTTNSSSFTSSGLTPWEDYNQRGDVVELLEKHSWKYVSQQGERVHLKRPGETDSPISGNFHTSKRKLRVFSTSTVFDSDIAYTPSQVFILLECNGDTKLAYKRLRELGYGEAYKAPNQAKDQQQKTEYIKVEAVNRVTGESSVISAPGESLSLSKAKESSGDEIRITAPEGKQYETELLSALSLLQRTDKKIYVRQGSEELREYRYQLRSIFSKYGSKSELTDRDIDYLLEEIVTTAQQLQPIDRDLFKKEFLSQPAILELGISEQSLSITIDRITATREKEAQAQSLQELLSEASSLQQTGQTEKALEALEERLQKVKIIGAQNLLPPPQSFNNLLEQIAEIPPAYKTGYSSLDSFIGFTPGAITLIAGRPSHGKTTFMFNLLLQMSELYKQENFYFFTYEEPLRNISVKLLTRLINTDLSGYFREIKDLPKPTNYEFIKSYIRAQRTDIRQIEEGKKQLQELIDSQRIKIIDRSYSVEQLSSLVAYLKNKEQIGALFIDYIQRMNTERKTQDKRTEIAHISDSVLQIAKDSGLPIILGAQLNRATDTKGGKPKLENLKEAGNLEEDANTVISVYCRAREEEETENGEQSSKQREVELEIKALKNREGEVNTTETLTWDRWTYAIRDRANSGRKSPF